MTNRALTSNTVGNIIYLACQWLLNVVVVRVMLGYYGTVSTIAVIVQSVASYVFNPLNRIIADYYVSGDRFAIRRLCEKVLLVLALATGAAIIGAVALGSIFCFIWRIYHIHTILFPQYFQAV